MVKKILKQSLSVSDRFEFMSHCKRDAGKIPNACFFWVLFHSGRFSVLLWNRRLLSGVEEGNHISLILNDYWRNLPICTRDKASNITSTPWKKMGCPFLRTIHFSRILWPKEWRKRDSLWHAGSGLFPMLSNCEMNFEAGLGILSSCWRERLGHFKVTDCSHLLPKYWK